MSLSETSLYMPDEQVVVPAPMADFVRWVVETVTPLVEESGWSLAINGEGDGMVQVEVCRFDPADGEEPVETRDLRRFRLTTPPRPRSAFIPSLII